MARTSLSARHGQSPAPDPPCPVDGVFRASRPGRSACVAGCQHASGDAGRGCVSQGAACTGRAGTLAGTGPSQYAPPCAGPHSRAGCRFGCTGAAGNRPRSRIAGKSPGFPLLLSVLDASDKSRRRIFEIYHTSSNNRDSRHARRHRQIHFRFFQRSLRQVARQDRAADQCLRTHA